MKPLSAVVGLLCLFFSAQMLLAQNVRVPSAAVSFYQLTYKPNRQAHRLFLKGLSQLKHGDFRLCTAAFRRAVEIDPLYWNAQNNLGYAYLKTDQPGRARQAFERAVAIDPQNAIGYANLSVVSLNSNDYAQAAQFARAALRHNPRLAEAKGFLGAALAGQGNWTPEAHRLLEEGQNYVLGLDKLLGHWPRPNSNGPKVLFVGAATP